MKTILAMCVLAAGIGLTGTTEMAKADHCRYGSGYGYGGYPGGYYYSAPSYRVAPPYHVHPGRYYTRSRVYGYPSGRGYYGRPYGTGITIRGRGFSFGYYR